MKTTWTAKSTAQTYTFWKTLNLQGSWLNLGTVSWVHETVAVVHRLPISPLAAGRLEYSFCSTINTTCRNVIKSSLLQLVIVVAKFLQSIPVEDLANMSEVLRENLAWDGAMMWVMITKQASG